MPGTVFLSYRRDDAAGHAGRLYDHLKARFPGRIFMDVGDIMPGTDFVKAIEDGLDECAALVAVIGTGWSRDDRLQEPGDVVRLELATALKRDICVIPVLVQGARLPDVAALPAELVPFVRRQAITIQDAEWDAGCQRLVRTLQSVLPLPLDSPRKRLRWALFSTAIIFTLTGVLLTYQHFFRPRVDVHRPNGPAIADPSAVPSPKQQFSQANRSGSSRPKVLAPSSKRDPGARVSDVAQAAKKAVVGVFWRTAEQKTMVTSGVFVERDVILTAKPREARSVGLVILFDGSSPGMTRLITNSLIRIGPGPGSTGTPQGKSGSSIPQPSYFPEKPIPQISPLRFSPRAPKHGDTLLLIGFNAENNQFDWEVATATLVNETWINYACEGQPRAGFSGGPILSTSGEVIGIQRGLHNVGQIQQPYGDIGDQQMVKYALQYERLTGK